MASRWPVEQGSSAVHPVAEWVFGCVCRSCCRDYLPLPRVRLPDYHSVALPVAHHPDKMPVDEEPIVMAGMGSQAFYQLTNGEGRDRILHCSFGPLKTVVHLGQCCSGRVNEQERWPVENSVSP